MPMPDEFDTTYVDTGEVTLHVAHAGSGPPLLLLHGYPQTHVMWHRLAGRLAQHFHVICPDLRGYGDSAKPSGGLDHAAYSKRAMAHDCVALMRHFGHERFDMVGHDRGARVGHRLALDHPEALSRLCVLDIAPTLHMFETAEQHFAYGYYHWFFLIQPDGLPERMIGADPAYYLNEKLKRWAAPGASFDPAAVAEYERCFRDPACIHATCEDYRAAAGIDLEHDRVDRAQGRQIDCPLLVLWGTHGFVHKSYDVLAVWRDYAREVQGRSLNCGHFVPEEAPDALYAELQSFLDFAD